MTVPLHRLAISCGDPSGIGQEVALQWALHHRHLIPSVILVGPHRWLEPFGKMGFSGLPAGPDDGWQPGVPSRQGSLAAFEALEVVAGLALDKRCQAVVTLPISKEGLNRVGFPFEGHTEFFADRWGGEPVMAFIWDRFFAALATWHLPLLQVPQALKSGRLERAVRVCHPFLRVFSGCKDPVLALCGVNPHAGENGLLGSDEIEWMNPCLSRLSGEYPGLISTALPGDTVWQGLLEGRLQGVIAAYHDQGLAAVKSLAFHSAVNVTLGLPFLRVSPDHGTAYSLVGKGRAGHTRGQAAPVRPDHHQFPAPDLQSPGSGAASGRPEGPAFPCLCDPGSPLGRCQRWCSRAHCHDRG